MKHSAGGSTPNAISAPRQRSVFEALGMVAAIRGSASDWQSSGRDVKHMRGASDVVWAKQAVAGITLALGKRAAVLNLVNLAESRDSGSKVLGKFAMSTTESESGKLWLMIDSATAFTGNLLTRFGGASIIVSLISRKVTKMRS